MSIFLAVLILLLTMRIANTYKVITARFITASTVYPIAYPLYEVENDSLEIYVWLFVFFIDQKLFSSMRHRWLAQVLST